MEEKLAFLENEKAALQESKIALAFEVNKLKEKPILKRPVGGGEDLTGEVEKGSKGVIEKIQKLKVEIKHIEIQWANSIEEILANFLAQAKVI